MKRKRSWYVFKWCQMPLLPLKKYENKTSLSGCAYHKKVSSQLIVKCPVWFLCRWRLLTLSLLKSAKIKFKSNFNSKLACNSASIKYRLYFFRNSHPASINPNFKTRSMCCVHQIVLNFNKYNLMHTTCTASYSFLVLNL